MAWHISKPGKEDLACMVKGHLICTANCTDIRCNEMEKGHCYRCDATIIGVSESDKKVYGPTTTVESFTSYPEEHK